MIISNNKKKVNYSISFTFFVKRDLLRATKFLLATPFLAALSIFLVAIFKHSSAFSLSLLKTALSTFLKAVFILASKLLFDSSLLEITLTAFLAFFIFGIISPPFKSIKIDPFFYNKHILANFLKKSNKKITFGQNNIGDILEKDLKNYKIRTDLAFEEKIENNKNIEIKIKQYENIKVTNIKLLKEIKEINKKKGTYITIEFPDITDFNNYKKVEKIFINEIKKITKKYNYILIVGLGNKMCTPDSIGPLVTEKIIPTNHLYELNLLDEGFKRICVFSPNVKGNTGIETQKTIKGIINEIKPELIIAVDSLASSSISHVNKTIQITNTGIAPGSGIGNKREELSQTTLNVPVIGIGVPTVVDAVTIVNDTIEYMHKHYAYNKKNYNNPINKLVINPNYLKEEIELKKEDKIKLLGIVGMLNKNETKELIYEVLSPIGYNLMVSPKEIDYEVKKVSDLIANGLNNALNNKVTHL